MRLPLGTDPATGELVTFDFDETANWITLGNDWWRVMQTIGNQTASVWIKRPPGWTPADGFTEAEVYSLNIYSGQLQEAAALLGDASGLAQVGDVTVTKA
jgi:hypothetical protein